MKAWIKVLIGIGMFVALATFVFIWTRSGCNQEEAVREQQVIRHAPNIVEIIPELRTDLKTKELQNQELYKELTEAHQKVDWYAEYTVELEKRLAEGEAGVTVNEQGYTVNWSELWSDGQTWTDGQKATYSIAYHIPPIDLQVYKTDKGVWLGSTTSGLVIGEVKVVEQVKKSSFWSKFAAEISAGTGNYHGKYTWLVGGQVSYSRIGVGGEVGDGWKSILISYHF